ncbi:MAG: lipase [Frankiales bacterium]|nr:lipase [Frankiales bacterium]
MSTVSQPFRTLLALTTLLARWGIGPKPMDVIKKSAAERQLSKPPTWMTRKGDPSIRTRNIHIQGRGGQVQIRVYTAPGNRPGNPGIVYLHGGAFVVGGLDGCDYITRGLASRTGFPVFSVEYRLAPETPHPGPLEDCEDALRWIVENAPEGIDPTRIAVGGDSAGGNLAAALTLLMRDLGGPAIAHQSLIYPFTDCSISSPDWDTYAGGGVDRDSGHLMVQMYAPNSPLTEPYVSVLDAPDHSGLPPALVLTAEHDVLHSDGVSYASKLLEAGVPVVYRDFAKMPHGFLTMPRLCKAAEAALGLVAAEMTKALAARTGAEPL